MNRQIQTSRKQDINKICNQLQFQNQVNPRCPMLFDMDSPHLQRFRQLSSTIKQSSDSLRLQPTQKSSDRQHTLMKTQSSKFDKVYSTKKEEQMFEVNPLKKIATEEKKKKIVFYRQRSEPQQWSRQTTNPLNQQSSYNQNVKRRLTSLEIYFEEAHSIQMPYRTKNRIYQNQKFISEVEEFQARLSANKQQQNITNGATTQRVSGKRNRLSETRPKKLKIQDLQNENVKKEKEKIFIDKIMKQRVDEYRTKIIEANLGQSREQKQNFDRPPKLKHQIKELSNDVQQFQDQIKYLRRQGRERHEKMKQINKFFGFF